MTPPGFLTLAIVPQGIGYGAPSYSTTIQASQIVEVENHHNPHVTPIRLADGRVLKVNTDYDSLMRLWQGALAAAGTGTK